MLRNECEPHPMKPARACGSSLSRPWKSMRIAKI